jgi:hypothetical protein
MTEAEWLACAGPSSMLAFLWNPDSLPVLPWNEASKCRSLSERKLRLYFVACCRLCWHLPLDKRSRHAIEVAERFVDRLATHEELALAEKEAAEAWNSLRHTGDALVGARELAEVAVNLAREDEGLFAMLFQTGVGVSVANFVNVVDAYTCFIDPAKRCDLLRDLFGSLFCPLPPRPEAIAPLAAEIYTGRWELMPLLGEWLQEHGFWSEGEHCLDPALTHVKGCWVVDWVTARECPPAKPLELQGEFLPVRSCLRRADYVALSGGEVQKQLSRLRQLARWVVDWVTGRQ